MGWMRCRCANGPPALPVIETLEIRQGKREVADSSTR